MLFFGQCYHLLSLALENNLLRPKINKKYISQLILLVLPFKAPLHRVAGSFTVHVDDHSNSNLQQAGFRKLCHTDDLQSEIFSNIIIPDKLFELVTTTIIFIFVAQL